MSDSDDKSNDGKDDDNSEWRELTHLDLVQGEWIAREIERKGREDAEHYQRAHSTDPIRGIINTIFGEWEECINPRCDIPESHAEFEAEDEAYRSESWWERWSRSREDKRAISELVGDSAESESWWERWFGNNGGDGEGGSSD